MGEDAWGACEVAREALSARLDGESPQVPTERVDAHLDLCRGCRALLIGAAMQARRLALAEVVQALRRAPGSLSVNVVTSLLKCCNYVIMKHHHVHGRRYGRAGGWQQAQQPDAGDAADWFAGRLPDTWFDGDPTVVVDREEITVIGKLSERENSQTEKSEARTSGRVSRFREETRPERMNIADEAQARYGRKVSWGVEAGGERIVFTHIAVPVMTRLKQTERQVLDTLVDAGVARSRSDALAWSVKLVAEHTEEWLAKLRDAMSAVDDLRAQGPEL